MSSVLGAYERDARNGATKESGKWVVWQVQSGACVRACVRVGDVVMQSHR